MNGAGRRVRAKERGVAERSEMNGRREQRRKTLSLLLLLIGVGTIGFWLGGRQAAPESPPRVQTELKASPSVVVSVRQLARLEGALFSIERIIDLKERQSRFLNLVQAEDALLLVAAGEVIAGVDLSHLQEGDVQMDAEASRVVVVLPRAEVFSSRLDNERTYVHSRRTNWAARRQEHLETRARQEAERTLRQAALDAQILRHAERSVEQTVSSLLASLGWREVEVRFRESRTLEELTPSAP